MSDDPSVTAADSRATVRLLGEVCAHPGDLIAKKCFLMDSLCQLIGADRWLWGLSAQMEPGKPPVHVGLRYGGFTEESLALFIQAYTHPEMSVIHEGFALELAHRGSHLTRLRQQIDPDDRYKTTAAYPYWEAADIEGIILSFCPLSATICSGVGIYRSHAAGMFTSRESRIAHIILSSIPDLHTNGWPEDYCATIPELSARERTTMTLLIQGYSRRKIAASMNLSPHTVNDYVKTVYKHLGVHSQAELICRFRRGDGGDR